MENVPIRMLGHTEGDHAIIQRIDGSLAIRDSRGIGTFYQLVWRQAQIALENPAIWKAVEALADELRCAFPDCASEKGPTVGPVATDTHATFSGDRARAIIRRSGVKPGMLGI